MVLLTHIWGDKEVDTFSGGLCPKLNVILYLEFKLAYYEISIQYISQNAMKNHGMVVLIIVLSMDQIDLFENN